MSLSTRRPDYMRMNGTLAAAARAHEELTIVNWAELTHGNDDWFHGDGVHLTYAGAIGMARQLRTALDQAFATGAESGTLARTSLVTVAATALPTARVGHPYDVTLLARGGLALPYRWSATPQLPRGLHLTAAGRLWGDPSRPFDVRIALRVEDGAGNAAVRSFRLVARV
jgi:hypothetical protein